MGSLKLVGIFFLSCALFAQVELNVEGDAKISGELELGENRNNVILGYLAGLNTTGNWNTFIGTRSGGSTTTGLSTQTGALKLQFIPLSRLWKKS